MQEVHVDDAQLGDGKLSAILSPEGIVGHIFTDAKDGTVAARLLPKYQGKGYGKLLLDRMADLGVTVKTVDECAVVDFYRKHGFEEIRKEGRFYFLKPPKSQQDWERFTFWKTPPPPAQEKSA
jgi:GNAT superfamily N-acetyltransferase